MKLLLPAAVVAVLGSYATAASAAPDLDEEGFRLYCGYLDASTKPELQKIKKPADRDKKIAQLAKVKPAALQAAVEKGQAIGATCAEVGKVFGASAKAAAEAAVPGRVLVFNFDDSDPSHVVAQVTWLGVDKKKLVEEASTIASALASESKIIKTIAIRAVDPTAPDKMADSAAWFEAKITRVNAARIDRAKIGDYAETRYVKLFDGVVRKDLAQP